MHRKKVMHQRDIGQRDRHPSTKCGGRRRRRWATAAAALCAILRSLPISVTPLAASGQHRSTTTVIFLLRCGATTDKQHRPPLPHGRFGDSHCAPWAGRRHTRSTKRRRHYVRISPFGRRHGRRRGRRSRSRSPLHAQRAKCRRDHFIFLLLVFLFVTSSLAWTSVASHVTRLRTFAATSGREARRNRRVPLWWWLWNNALQQFGFDGEGQPGHGSVNGARK